MYKLFFLLLLSCSHDHKRIEDIRGSYQVHKVDLNLESSFAFEFEGSEYYFAQKMVRKPKNKCSYYIGFVNGRAMYYFPGSVFWNLENVYNLKQTPEERMALALQVFDDFQKNPRGEDCRDAPTHVDEVVDTVLNMIPYSPALILVSPLLAAQYIDSLHVPSNDLKLGMSFKKVHELLGPSHHSSHRIENKISYWVFDRKQFRIVTYFKDNKLKAWVRGYKPHQSR